VYIIVVEKKKDYGIIANGITVGGEGWGDWSQSLASEDPSTSLNTNTNIYTRCYLS
jgi:hypothetical protein